MRCPQCGQGELEAVSHPLAAEQTWIRCTAYPTCRFEASSWEAVGEAAARFHHRILPGHHH
ncbi:MAG: hypothetical protein K6U87_03160 [Firmicutes bacterium]|nr:hypothetical protein [Bacillota bacterium]